MVNGGSLTFKNTASLVQINNVSNTNSGNIRYERQTTRITKMDYTYWSTPVSPFTLGGVSPNTMGDKMYSFDSSIEDWKQRSLPQLQWLRVWVISFEVLKILFLLCLHQPTSLLLLVCPIMVTMKSREFLPINPIFWGIPIHRLWMRRHSWMTIKMVLDGTLYFWTHNTPIAIGRPDPGSGLYAYSGDDYASYNRTGGVATAAAPSASTGGLNTNIPSGKIASGQGFFGSSKVSITGSTIVYNNNMRVGVGLITGSNDQFFKTKNPKGKSTAIIETPSLVGFNQCSGRFQTNFGGLY